MAQDSIGRNQVFPIYNADETPFHGLVLHKSTVESIIMSLGDKISGDVYYANNSLAFTMQEYIVYNGVKYVLVNPPTVVREGKASDNGELKGMTKYSLTFYHPMYMLGNFPFTDIAVTQDEEKYLSQSKTFAWIGNLFDFVAKLNANLAGTDWIVAANIVHYEQDGTTVTSEWSKAEKISDVLSFDKQFVADALKTAFDTWGIPFTIVKTNITGKKFLVEFGLPSQEIYGQDGVTPFIFQFGQGVGLSNNSRTPKNNKIITRLAGEGSERNIPYGYPQIIWTGNQDWDYTINNASGMQSITVGGETIQAMSYPIYDGIVGGQKVRLIKHPFTRKTLMPSIYAETVNLKVNPNATGYAPNTVIVDYYDATSEENYPNPINPSAPSFENHQFEDIYPRLGDDVALVGVYPYDERTFISISEFNTLVGSKIDQSDIEYEKGILRALIQTIAEATSSFNSSHADANYSYSVNARATVYEYGIWFDVDYTSDDANFRCNVYRGTYSPRDYVDWDDTMDDDGNYEQSYFKIRLPQLSFDVYASASITESMEINMHSGACLGCTFQIQVDWDDYKRNFFDADGNFDPVIGTGHPRDGEKYPDSSQGQIDVVVQKDINTFGTLMPNEYQQPASGDKFVILGISLPLTYITAAEEELNDAMKAYMLENNVHYYDYPLKFDEYFLATHTEILSQIKNNSIVRFKYAGTDVALYVKQITVKYNDGVLPKYDIVLTDDIEVVLSKIGQVVDDVDKLSYIVSAMRQSSSTNELKDLKDINTKLSRVQEDTAKGKITFADGVKFGTSQSAHGIEKNGDADLHHIATGGNVTIGNYNRSTAPHTGAKITSGGDGDFVDVTTENLAVTKEAHFFKLVVDELLSNKGAIIISSANCIAESVNEDHSTYTILFSKTDRDGNPVNNPWKVGDHALCLTFQGEGVGTFTNVRNRYYWRKVVSIYTGDTYHSISLSKTDGEGSTVPAAGDNIVQLGYSGQVEIPSRQTAIILSSYPTMDTEVTPPSLAFYKGINDFALSSHRYTYMDGVNNDFFGNFKVLASGSYTDLTTILATMDGVISTVSKTVRGKNIISSDGWTDFNGNLLGADNYNEATQMLTNGSTHEDVVWSPIFFLPAGTYTFSCYSSSSDIELYVYNSYKRADVPDSLDDVTSYYINNSRSGDSYQEVGRKYVSFTLDNDAYVCLNLYVNDSQFTVYRPMLESGSSVSDWESGVITKTSQIKQTADSIDLSIRSDLGTVGININGDDKEIKLLANKVNFYDSTGKNLNPKVWIDPTTGAIHAVDGEFEGTVRATNLFHSVCYFTEGNTIDNGEYYSNENSNVLYYYNEDLVSETPPAGFVDGNYYTEEEIGEYKGDACFIPTTGKADVAMCMPRVGYNWEPDNYGNLPYIRLPKPEDFQGKVVEVSGFCYAENNSGTFVKTFGVRCVCGDFDPNDRRMSGLVYSDPDGHPRYPIRTVIPFIETVISTGGTARFMSVELSDGSWVWVLLANQTGGDVYIGDGSISGGTVTEVGMSVPTGFSVSPEIITTHGTFTLSFGGTLTKNRVLATPSTADGAPSWRSLVADDIPSLAASKIMSGTFDAARIPNISWNKITSDKPTTIADYGITDAKIVGTTITLGNNTITPLTSFTESDPTVPLWAKQSSKPSYQFREITNKPTTIAGYGITDANIENGVITLGSNTITPMTSEVLSGYLPLTAGDSNPLTGDLCWSVQNATNNLRISNDGIQLLVSGVPYNVVLFDGSTANNTSYAKFFERPMVKTGTENGAPVYTNVALASELDGKQAKITFYDQITGNNITTSWSKLYAPIKSYGQGNVELGYLPLTGGTLTGNLRLKDSTNYGKKILFGDSEYCYLHEDTDNHLKVYAKEGVTVENETDRILFITPPDYHYFTDENNVNEAWYYTGTSAYDFYRSLLIWLCEQYGEVYSGKNVMLVMKTYPGSRHMAMLNIYDPSIVDGETGLPQYAFGMAIPMSWSQSFVSFGSSAYAYYYNGGKVAEAAKLSTARTIWSQPFDGSGNVSGDLAVTNAEIKVSNGNGGWVHQMVHTASGASESTYKFYTSQNTQNSTPVTMYEFDKNVRVKKLIADEVQADNINAGLDIIMEDVSVSWKTGRLYVDNGELYYQYDNGTPVRIA